MFGGNGAVQEYLVKCKRERGMRQMSGIRQIKIRRFGQEMLKYFPTYVNKRKNNTRLSYRRTLLRNQV